MYRRRHRKTRFLYALADIALLTLAFEAAYQTRLALPLERVFYLLPPVKVLLLGFSVLSWVLAALWQGLYEKFESRDVRLALSATTRQCLLGALAVVVLEYLMRFDLSRPFLVLFVAYAWSLLFLSRVLAPIVAGAVLKSSGARLHVVIVGLSDRALRLGEMIEQASGGQMQLVGFLSPDPLAAPGEIRLGAVYPVHPAAELPALLERHVVDEIIVAVEGKAITELEDLLLLCDEEGVKTRIVVDSFPHINSEVYLDHLQHIPMLTFAAAPDDELRLLAKRLIDVALGAAGLLLLLPFMAVIALLIRLTSPGPTIFRQVRCGLNGRRFTLFKFRSMCANAEELKAELLPFSDKDTAFKMTRDPRLTPLGRWLRKFSIDEWPQLWNVLKGDMSLVGPRPAVPEEVEQYKRWQRRRLRMRPGLTCLWALAGRDHLDFESWMKLDMQYIDTWSLGLDWMIMLKTIPHVLSGKGAH